MGVPTLLVARTDADSAKLLTQRRRRARPRVHRPKASARPRASSASRAAWSAPSRAAWPTRRTRTCSGARRRTPDLDAGAAVRRGRSTRSSRASCWRTTARRRSTGRSTSTTRPSPSSSASSGAMGYKFQFVTLAGFHALNYSMFELARGYRDARHGGLLASCSRREFGAREATATPRRAPARGGHRLLRRGGRGHLRRQRLHPGARTSPPRSEQFFEQRDRDRQGGLSAGPSSARDDTLLGHERQLQPRRLSCVSRGRGGRAAVRRR